ncbi:MAG: PhzF family phenazine biosynthesis protein [Kangiellaceae bacterium]|jgi:PhzF family phenazine biosynthesis protein|nr:PhzF family phenazine biosynthesis protein [Kangiellaceae bacterium]
MQLPIYQVDAFATKVFEGNPAAVIPLDNWLPDDTLQKIAEENNLSETAYFVAEGTSYRLRWFTPEEEVDLCGHATLATAHVIFTHLEYQESHISFLTRSGELIVERHENQYVMNFPASMPESVATPKTLELCLGITPKSVLAAFDYVVVLESEADVLSVQPDFVKLAELDKRGVLITAPGDSVDFVSRCFFPSLRVNEDPVTGSAHCELAPYWGKQLGKTELTAVQLSERSGRVECQLVGDRVVLKGSAIGYMKGMITI